MEPKIKNVNCCVEQCHEVCVCLAETDMLTLGPKTKIILYYSKQKIVQTLNRNRKKCEHKGSKQRTNTAYLMA